MAVTRLARLALTQLSLVLLIVGSALGQTTRVEVKSKDLSTGAFSFTTVTLAGLTSGCLSQVITHFSAAPASVETIKVFQTSRAGTTSDSLLAKQSTLAATTQDVVFLFSNSITLNSGDQIKVTSTNNSAATTITATVIVDTVGPCLGNGYIIIRDGIQVAFYRAGGNCVTNLSVLAPTTSLQLSGLLTDETGSDLAVFSESPSISNAILTAPRLGTPFSGVMTNVTGTAAGLTAGNVTTNANLTGHVTSVGNAAVLGSFTSAHLATALTNETGSGLAVFGTAPDFLTTTKVTSADNTASTNISSVLANNLTAGIGLGWKNLRAIGTAANQTLELDGKGTGGLIFQATATGGVQIGSPTGNDQGTGALNTSGSHFINGKPVYRIYNVLDKPYNAVGDGVTDDRAAIQAAITAAAGLGQVYIPHTSAGFVIAGALNIPSNSYIREEALIFLKSGSNSSMFLLANGATSVVIDGNGTGILDGNNAGQVSGSDLGIGDPTGASHVVNIRIRGIRVTNQHTWGISMRGHDIVIDHVQIDSTPYASQCYNDSYDCHLTNSLVYGMTDIGFCFYGAVYNSSITDSVFHDNVHGTGVFSDSGQTGSSHDIILANNLVYHNAQAGIYLYEADAGVANHYNLNVSGNSLWDNDTTHTSIGDLYIKRVKNSQIVHNYLGPTFAQSITNAAPTLTNWISQNWGPGSSSAASDGGLVATPTILGGNFVVSGATSNASQALTNSSDTILANALTPLPLAVNTQTYPYEFRFPASSGAIGGSTARLLIGGYRRTADASWPGSSWRISTALDSTYTTYNTEISYLELGNNNQLFLGTAGVDRVIIGPGTQLGAPTGGDKGAGTLNSAGSLYVNNGLVALRADDLSVFAATTSLQLAGVVSNETGSGLLVFNNTPTLIAPLLGTPTSGVATNLTGTASGLTAGNVTTNANLTGHVTSVGNAAVLGSFTSLQLATALTNETGSGLAVFGTAPVIVGGSHTALTGLGVRSTGTGAFDLTLANTENLTAGRTLTLTTGDVAHTLSFGTSAGTITFPTGTKTIPATADNLSVFAATTSLQLIGVISDETGTGAAVFGTSPTFTTGAYTPLLLGGTLTTSPLALRSTSGVGAAGADIIFQTGNNGSTEAGRFLNSGNLGLGIANPLVQLAISGELNSVSGTVKTFVVSSSGNGGYAGTRSNDYYWIRTNDVDRVKVSATGTVAIPNIKSNTLVRYVCVDVNGLLSSGTVCTGT